MKKTLLLTVFFISTIPSVAQGLEWGLNIAPGISYRFAPREAPNIRAASIQGGEEAMYVFDFGMDVRKQIAPRLSLGTGVFYSQKGFSNTNTAAVYDDPGLSRRYLIDFVQDYLDIPFFLTYDLIQNDRFTFYTQGGIVNSLLLKSKNSVSATSGEVSEETILRLRQPYLENQLLHNLGMQTGLGIKTDVDAKTALGLEAMGKLMASPLTDEVNNTRRRLCAFNVNFRFIRKIR